ncbi:MAG: YbaN family protein [Clostridiales bacterium]|nr:YbaN family protein [Clostridiales bacterium]
MLKKVLFIGAGAAALVLGVLGVALPVLPTAPFLLLALYCFTKGSDKLSQWFQGTSLYKKRLAEYRRTKSLTLKRKLSIQIFAGSVMVISFITIDSLVLRVILALGFIAHNYVFLFVIKTRKDQARNNKDLISDKRIRLNDETNENAL